MKQIQDIGFGFFGLILIYLSVKNFYLYAKGGAFGINLHKPLSPGFFEYKAKGDKVERVLLLRNAAGFLFMGIVLCILCISSLTNNP